MDVPVVLADSRTRKFLGAGLVLTPDEGAAVVFENATTAAWFVARFACELPGIELRPRRVERVA